MFEFELLIHSYLRWFIFICLFTQIIFIFHGYFLKREFNNYDKYLSYINISFLHIQFIIGLFLYFQSPIIELFFQNHSEFMKIKETRFFAIEHSITMGFAIILITIGYSLSKREEISSLKFKKLLIFYTISFLLILVSIPWEFSDYIQRPLFR